MEKKKKYKKKTSTAREPQAHGGAATETSAGNATLREYLMEARGRCCGGRRGAFGNEKQSSRFQGLFAFVCVHVGKEKSRPCTGSLPFRTSTVTALFSRL